MDAYFLDRPKTWKYALPWAMVIPLILVFWKMAISPNPEMQFWSMLPAGLAFLCFIVGCVKLWEKVSTHAADLYTQHQEALSMTPLVLLSQNMKQMHPEAVRVLNRFGVRTSWQVRMNLGERDWVLADTNVHFGFIEFVLSNSNTALYPMNRFSQGAKKWDPDGLVEDREQHAEFERWLFARMMVTRSHGDFKPAEFIPPWTPALIMETMGMTGEQDLYRPEEEPRKDLNTSTQPAPGNGNGQKKVENGKPLYNEPTYHPVSMEPELTDADMEAIRKVEAEHAAKYGQN